MQVLQSQLVASKAEVDKLRQRVKELEDEYLGDFNKADLDGDGELAVECRVYIYRIWLQYTDCCLLILRVREKRVRVTDR